MWVNADAPYKRTMWDYINADAPYKREPCGII